VGKPPAGRAGSTQGRAASTPAPPRRARPTDAADDGRRCPSRWRGRRCALLPGVPTQDRAARRRRHHHRPSEAHRRPGRHRRHRRPGRHRRAGSDASSRCRRGGRASPSVHRLVPPPRRVEDRRCGDLGRRYGARRCLRATVRTPAGPAPTPRPSVPLRALLSGRFHPRRVRLIGSTRPVPCPYDRRPVDRRPVVRLSRTEVPTGSLRHAAHPLTGGRPSRSRRWHRDPRRRGLVGARAAWACRDPTGGPPQRLPVSANGSEVQPAPGAGDDQGPDAAKHPPRQRVLRS